MDKTDIDDKFVDAVMKLYDKIEASGIKEKGSKKAEELYDKAVAAVKHVGRAEVDYERGILCTRKGKNPYRRRVGFIIEVAKHEVLGITRNEARNGSRNEVCRTVVNEYGVIRNAYVKHLLATAHDFVEEALGVKT
jgi:hypothetical protein